MEDDQEKKWKGKTSAKVNRASAGQVWMLLKDFCNVHKWLPGIETCQQVEGVTDQPGCIRYCTGEAIPSADGSPFSWAKEKLVSIDPIERTFSYEIADNNIGFGSYKATMKVLSDVGEGCQIEWSFLADPVNSFTQEGFVSYLEFSLQTMAKRMEEALQASY